MNTPDFAIPKIEEYQRLIPIAQKLYSHTSGIAFQMLLPLFLVSIALSYSRDLGVTGAIVSRLRALLTTSLLLVAFPYIASFAQTLGIEIALSIDNLIGIDQILEAASKKASEYSFNINSLLSMGNDLILAFFVGLSFVIILLARFFVLAFQHFYWLTLVVLGPFLILGNLFEGTSGITRNLFKNLFQVAAWPIFWAILSAFLKALPVADAYASPGGYTTVIVLNFVIALALLGTSKMVSEFANGISYSAGDSINKMGVAVLKAIPTKGKSLVKDSAKYIGKKVRHFVSNQNSENSTFSNKGGSK